MEEKEIKNNLKRLSEQHLKIENSINILRNSGEIKPVRFNESVQGLKCGSSVSNYVEKLITLEEQKDCIQSEIKQYTRCTDTPKQEGVLIFRYLHGLKFLDISSIMRYSLSTVVRIHEAGISAIKKNFKKFENS